MNNELLTTQSGLKEVREETLDVNSSDVEKLQPKKINSCILRSFEVEDYINKQLGLDSDNRKTVFIRFQADVFFGDNVPLNDTEQLDSSVYEIGIIASNTINRSGLYIQNLFLVLDPNSKEAMRRATSPVRKRSL